MKLRWSKEEERKVLERAAELRRDEPELTALDSLYRGQSAIDPMRVKKMFTFAYQKALLSRLPSAEQRLRSKASQIVAPPPEVLTPPPAPPPAPTLNELLAEKLRELGTTFATVIAEALAPALVAAMAKHQSPAPVPMEHAIAHPGNGKNGHDAIDKVEEKLPEKFRTHKVAILPMNNSQQQELKSRFPHLDFRFLSNDQKAQHIEQVTKHCEATFVMTRWCAHKSEQAVSAEHPKVRVNGGLTELSRLIESRFPRSTSMDVTH